MKLNLEYTKGILFVRIEGNLNRRTSHKLNNYLIPAIMKHGIKYLVYNLYDLKNIDDMGIKSLANGVNAVKENAGETLICEIPDNLKENFNSLSVRKLNNELQAIEILNI